MMQRIGLMGGTFDPPHIGHLAMAEYVRQALDLAEVWFIPTGGVSYKESTNLSSAADRLAMVELAVAGNPYFTVNPIEAESGENSYTFQTLECLKKQFPKVEFTFIVGADSLAYMDRWREPMRIFQNCTVAAVNRSGVSKELLKKKQSEFAARFGADIRLVFMPTMDVSSTELRKRVSNGESIRYMVSERVQEYIKAHHLYQK